MAIIQTTTSYYYSRRLSEIPSFCYQIILASLWCCKDLICLTLADEDTHGKLVDAVAGVEVGVGGKAIAIAFKLKGERWVAS